MPVASSWNLVTTSISASEYGMICQVTFAPLKLTFIVVVAYGNAWSENIGDPAADSPPPSETPRRCLKPLAGLAMLVTQLPNSACQPSVAKVMSPRTYDSKSVV